MNTPRYTRVACSRCGYPAAYTLENTSAPAVICNLCVLDEHTVLRFFGFVTDILPSGNSDNPDIRAETERVMQSNSVLECLNNFRICGSIIYEGE